MSEEAAVREWAPLAYWIARRFELPGADRDDVRQEALIALWQAQRSYDGTIPIRAHLAISIHRRLCSALKVATRLKHGPLNEALREPESLGVHGPGGDSGSLNAWLMPLTPLERRAVVGVACGMEYAELGPSKAVDNALQRARRKLRAA